MKKLTVFLLCLWLACGILCTSAAAEDIWVKEEWQHVQRQEERDGLTLVIDAQVLQTDEGATGQIYRTETLSFSFMKEYLNGVDWSQFGCDASSGRWRQPTKTWPEYVFVSSEGIYPSFGLGALNNFSFRKSSPNYAYKLSGNYSDTVDLSPIGTLTEADIRQWAEKVAALCGLQLGEPMATRRGDQAEDIRAAMEATDTPGNPEEYQFIDLLIPVYFQGLRLYSGTYATTTDEQEIPTQYMRIIVTRDHGLLSANCPVFDPSNFYAAAQPQTLLSAEEALERICDYLVNMKRPKTNKLNQIIIHRLALEYVPVANDIVASKGYTVYPAWVIKYTLIYENQRTYTFPFGLNALTGEMLFY